MTTLTTDPMPAEPWDVDEGRATLHLTPTDIQHLRAAMARCTVPASDAGAHGDTLISYLGHTWAVATDQAWTTYTSGPLGIDATYRVPFNGDTEGDIVVHHPDPDLLGNLHHDLWLLANGATADVRAVLGSDHITVNKLMDRMIDKVQPHVPAAAAQLAAEGDGERLDWFYPAVAVRAWQLAVDATTARSKP